MSDMADAVRVTVIHRACHIPIINGIPYSPTPRVGWGISEHAMSRTPPLGHYQMSIHLAISRSIAMDRQGIDAIGQYYGNSPCQFFIARGWASGGITDRCITWYLYQLFSKGHKKKSTML